MGKSCSTYLLGDLNEDCYINMLDLVILLTNWLQCNDIYNPQCQETEQPLSVVISEFMAVNSSGITDEDEDRSDWIELFNAGDQAVDLNGWYLTDNINDLTKWAFPSVPIETEGFLVVFASGKDRAIAGQELHTNFTLGETEGYLALVKADGITIVCEYNPYPTQFADISYGMRMID